MVKKDHLFYLIKSLSSSEKRYFKLTAIHSNDSANYIDLFDYIDKQKVYDETELRKKFQNKKFISQLHVTKNYLTKIILKSLRNYYEKSSKEAELLETLFNIEILLYKELYEICSAEIKRALKLAQQYERWAEILIILDYQKRLYLATKGIKRKIVDLNDIIESEKNILQKCIKLNQSWHLINNIFEYIRDNKINEESLKKYYVPGSLTQNTLYNYLKMSVAFSKSNITEAESLAKETIRNWEENPLRIKESPSSYITTINNLIGIYLQQRKYNPVEKLLLKVREVPDKYKISKNSPLTTRAVLHTYNVQLEIYRDTKQLDQGCKIIEEAEAHFNKNHEKGPRDTLLLLFYQSSHILYLAGKEQEALKYLNRIINEKWDNHRHDIQRFAYLLYLVIHFELENINLLRYTIESCRRFFKKLHILGAFEKEILSLFSKLTSNPKIEHPKIFQQASKRIFKDLTLKEKENILDYFNFEEWLNSKL